MRTLHGHPLSGHAHRAQLFLSILGLERELVDVDLLAGVAWRAGLTRDGRVQRGLVGAWRRRPAASEERHGQQGAEG